MPTILPPNSLAIHEDWPRHLPASNKSIDPGSRGCYQAGETRNPHGCVLTLLPGNAFPDCSNLKHLSTLRYQTLEVNSTQLPHQYADPHAGIQVDSGVNPFPEACEGLHAIMSRHNIALIPKHRRFRFRINISTPASPPYFHYKLEYTPLLCSYTE